MVNGNPQNKPRCCFTTMDLVQLGIVTGLMVMVMVVHVPGPEARVGSGASGPLCLLCMYMHRNVPRLNALAVPTSKNASQVQFKTRVVFVWCAWCGWLLVDNACMKLLSWGEFEIGVIML